MSLLHDYNESLYIGDAQQIFYAGLDATNRAMCFQAKRKTTQNGVDTMAIYNGFTSKAAAKRALAESGFTFGAALASPESNPKVFKNMKSGVMTSPLHLAPANLSGFNTCAMASEGCKAACLHTAGNPAYMPNKTKARIARTLAYFKARKAFVALVAFEIESLAIKAGKADMQAGVRLNATSDIPWESVALTVNNKPVASLIEAFPNVEFYDYTKVTKRALKHAAGLLPQNYHITFSKTESNDSDVARVLEAGGNVAVVFDKLPESYMGFPVINGDETDFRPSDDKGVVVGLKAKGDAKADESGFVVRIANKYAKALANGKRIAYT